MPEDILTQKLPTSSRTSSVASSVGLYDGIRLSFSLPMKVAELRQGITSDAVTVPTQQERGGDFSAGPAFTGVLSDDAVATKLGSRPGCTSAVAANGGAAIATGTPYASIFPGQRYSSSVL